MATKNTAEAPVATTSVRAQYIRDLSFENPNPLAVFTSDSQEQPEISVGIHVRSGGYGSTSPRLARHTAEQFTTNAERDDEFAAWRWFCCYGISGTAVFSTK